MKWGLNQQSCGLLCLHCGFWHQLAWTRVGETGTSNRAVCCTVKMVGVLFLRLKGFSSPDIREQWRYYGVQAEKAEEPTTMWLRHTTGQLKGHKGYLLQCN